MKYINKCLLLFITITFCNACSESPASSGSSPDSASVKILNADSNSDMPVHIPQDSMERMPNALDSTQQRNTP